MRTTRPHVLNWSLREVLEISGKVDQKGSVVDPKNPCSTFRNKPLTAEEVERIEYGAVEQTTMSTPNKNPGTLRINTLRAVFGENIPMLSAWSRLRGHRQDAADPQEPGMDEIFRRVLWRHARQ